MPVIGLQSKDGTEIELSQEARRQGVYLIGTTGTGKSTLLQNIAFEDMQSGEGLCVLDPHGDLTKTLLELVPENRLKDVVYFDPTDVDRPFGLNLLECDRNDPTQVRWVVSTVIKTLQRLFFYSWGPRLEHVLRSTLHTAMLIEGSTFIELLLLLTDEDYRNEVLRELDDPIVQKFWEDFPRRHRERYELISSTLNKISPFLTDRAMRNIVGQSTNSFDMQSLMDEGKILFVNLSKGDLGEDNSALIGSVLVNLILMASLKRVGIPFHGRRPFHLIVDEFQNFATESFAVLQSEARKYAVDVIVAHQFRDQLDERSKGSTLNVANFFVMRVSGKDGQELASQFDNTPPPADTKMEPVYEPFGDIEGEQLHIPIDLPSGHGRVHHEVELPRRTYSDVELEMANALSVLPNYQARCRLVLGDQLSEFPIKTLPEMGERNIGIAEKIRESSRRKYGRERQAVEAEISNRIFHFDKDNLTASSFYD